MSPLPSHAAGVRLARLGAVAALACASSMGAQPSRVGTEFLEIDAPTAMDVFHTAQERVELRGRSSSLRDIAWSNDRTGGAGGVIGRGIWLVEAAPLAPGANVLRVKARAPDGSELSDSIIVRSGHFGRALVRVEKAWPAAEAAREPGWIDMGDYAGWSFGRPPAAPLESGEAESFRTSILFELEDEFFVSEIHFRERSLPADADLSGEVFAVGETAALAVFGAGGDVGIEAMVVHGWRHRSVAVQRRLRAIEFRVVGLAAESELLIRDVAIAIEPTPAQVRPPEIVRQPADDFARPRSHAVRFLVEASGVPEPEHAWEVSRDGGATWTPLFDRPGVSGARSPVLELAGVIGGPVEPGAQFRCVVCNLAGEVVSQPAAVRAIPGAGRQGAYP